MSILEFIYEMIKVYAINRKEKAVTFATLKNHYHYDMHHYCRRQSTPLLRLLQWWYHTITTNEADRSSTRATIIWSSLTEINKTAFVISMQVNT